MSNTAYVSIYSKLIFYDIQYKRTFWLHPMTLAQRNPLTQIISFSGLNRIDGRDVVYSILLVNAFRLGRHI